MSMSQGAALHAGRVSEDETGRSTRARLLETAGKIFAEKGFDRATGKEICLRAGVNVAAINYYFGSLDGLYAAVLEEAQARLVTYDAIAAAVEGKSGAKAKLRAVIDLAVRRLTAPPASSWMFRVLAREITAPSETFVAMRQKDILPRARLMRSIVSELLRLPPEHPAVARASFSIIAPFAMLSIADRTMLARALPSLALDAKGAEALAEHLYCFAMAGLDSIRKSGRETMRRGGSRGS